MSAPLPGSAVATGADQHERAQPLPAATRLALLTRQVAGSGRLARIARSAPRGLSGVVLAATATRPHLSAVSVVVVLVVLASSWFVRVWLWPFAPCGRCDGSGRNIGSTGKRFGTCRKCKGSGRRQRLGSKRVRQIASRKR